MNNSYYFLQKKLKEYISCIVNEKKYTQDQIEEFIDLCELSFLLEEMVMQKGTRKKIIYSEIIQEKKNILFKNEILYLSEQAKKAGIKLIILKGILLADKYYPIPSKRHIADLDLFVDRKDFKKLLLICKDNGYLLENGKKITSYRVDKHLGEMATDQHFDIIVKNIDGINICIDVHLRLFQQLWFGEASKQIPKDLCDRSVVSEVKDFSDAYELELHDLIIYLQLHFIQHFYKNILEGFCYNDFYFQKKIGSLFDIALILKNNNDNLDWNKYIKLVNKYNLNFEMANSISFLNEIFGNLTPEFVVKKLLKNSNTYEKNCFYNYICKYIIEKEISFKNLLTIDECLFVQDFIKWMISQSKNKYVISYKNQIYFKKLFFSGGKNKQNVNTSASVILNITKDKVIVIFRAMYKECLLTDYIEMSKHYKTPKLIMKITFHDLDHNVNNIAVKLFRIMYRSSKNNIEYFCEECNDIIIKKDDKEYIINIPWSILKIKPEVGKYIGFNFEWIYSDNYLKGFSKMNITGNMMWHDIVGLNYIKLIE